MIKKDPPPIYHRSSTKENIAIIKSLKEDPMVWYLIGEYKQDKHGNPIACIRNACSKKSGLGKRNGIEMRTCKTNNKTVEIYCRYNPEKDQTLNTNIQKGVTNVSN